MPRAWTWASLSFVGSPTGATDVTAPAAEPPGEAGLAPAVPPEQAVAMTERLAMRSRNERGRLGDCALTMILSGRYTRMR